MQIVLEQILSKMKYLRITFFLSSDFPINFPASKANNYRYLWRLMKASAVDLKVKDHQNYYNYDLRCVPFLNYLA